MTKILEVDNHSMKDKGSSLNLGYHFIFWLAVFLILLLINASNINFGRTILTVLIAVIFYALIAYFNLFVLFPKYVKDKRLGYHLLWLGLTAIVLTPLRSIILYLISLGSPDLQASHIANQPYVFVTILFAGISTTIYLITNDWLNQQRIQQEIDKQRLQSELNFLKSQINPHFLFNTLNNLYALTLKKSESAPDIVLKLSDMMRYMLYECNEKTVPLEKELTYIKNYLELEKLRRHEKIKILVNIEGKPEKLEIAPLLLIPFIENAFKHSAKKHGNQYFISIYLNINNNELNLSVENSVSSNNIQDPKLPGGIGLVNVKRRLELLYPEKHKLDIKSTSDTFTVKLYLELSE